MCNHFKEFKVCTSKCKDFEEIPCLRRDRFIGACNNCPEIKKCRKAKYFYYANYFHNFRKLSRNNSM